MKASSREPSPADRDLESRVADFLRGHRRLAVSSVTVRADRGTVRLRGTVRSFYEKQLCILCARHVAGVLELIDEIVVTGT